MRKSQGTTSKRGREQGESSKQRRGRNASDNFHFTQEEVLHEVVAGKRKVALNTADLAKFEYLKSKAVTSWNYIDPLLLDSFGCREAVERLMAQPYWTQLFEWRDHTYDPVVSEFVASLNIIEGRLATPTIEFRVFNSAYQVSVDDLGRLLGFYTRDEQESDWYRELPIDFENDRIPSTYWESIAIPGIPWKASRVHGSAIARHDLSVVRRIIAHSWHGRRSNYSKVYRSDIFCLWSMDTGNPINMGRVCKSWLEKQQVADCENIFIGPLVSRLCIGLGYTALLAREGRVASMAPLLRGDMLALGIPSIIPESVDSPPPSMPTFPSVPMHFATVTNWTTMQAFMYQLHRESMASQQLILARQDDLEAQIEELYRDFMKFHPPAE